MAQNFVQKFSTSYCHILTAIWPRLLRYKMHEQHYFPTVEHLEINDLFVYGFEWKRSYWAPRICRCSIHWLFVKEKVSHFCRWFSLHCNCKFANVIEKYFRFLESLYRSSSNAILIASAIICPTFSSWWGIGTATSKPWLKPSLRDESKIHENAWKFPTRHFKNRHQPINVAICVALSEKYGE